jgi:hypothetical protein
MERINKVSLCHATILDEIASSKIELDPEFFMGLPL